MGQNHANVQFSKLIIHHTQELIIICCNHGDFKILLTCKHEKLTSHPPSWNTGNGKVYRHHIGLYRADFINQLQERKAMECQSIGVYVGYDH